MSKASSSSSSSLAGLDSLRDLLGDIMGRIETLEHKVGVTTPLPLAPPGATVPGSAATKSFKRGKNKSKRKKENAQVCVVAVVVVAAVSNRKAKQLTYCLYLYLLTMSQIINNTTHHHFMSAGEVPAVKAYDAYIKECVHPLAEACDNLKGLQTMGDLLLQAFEGIRTIVVLASRAKLPVGEEHNGHTIVMALQPHLTSTQQAIQSIRELKLDRDWDRHQKAVTEMLGCLSWVLLRAPQTLPVPMVKETLASAEFWSNRIRKDFKGKDETQIAFCDGIKKTVSGLAEYVAEYHKTGLTFNPRGVSLAEAAIRLSDEAETAAEPAEQQKALKSPVQKRHPTLGTNVVAGGNLAGVMGELAKRKSADGSSAATGLKHVSLLLLSS